MQVNFFPLKKNVVEHCYSRATRMHLAYTCQQSKGTVGSGNASKSIVPDQTELYRSVEMRLNCTQKSLQKDSVMIQ